MAYYLNPKRRQPQFFVRLLIKYFTKLGFKNIDYYYVHGEGRGNVVKLGTGVSLCDAVLNISSGSISIGQDTIFGHGVMVLTGFHQFYEGTLAKLSANREIPEVPNSGFDISIGSGCFI